MKFIKRIILPILAGFFFMYLRKHVDEDSTLDNMLFGLMIISFLFTAVMIYGLTKICESCGSWFAMEVKSEELINEKPSHIIKTLETTNRKGEVIAKQRVSVPATIYTIHVTEICTYCQQRVEYDKNLKEEN